MSAATVTVQRKPHCATCRCEHRGPSLTVYPPNETLYGCCADCGVVRWTTEVWTHDSRAGWTPARTEHCRCCADRHPHDLPPGGHDLPARRTGGTRIVDHT